MNDTAPLVASRIESGVKVIVAIVESAPGFWELFALVKISTRQRLVFFL